MNKKTEFKKEFQYIIKKNKMKKSASEQTINRNPTFTSIIIESNM